MKLAFPIVILIALVAFVGGVTLKNSFVAPYNLALDAESLEDEASGSAQVSEDMANLPQVSNESAPATNTHIQNGNTYTSTDKGDKIVISGKFNLSTYKLNFIFNLPKNGGDITGSVSGACEGTITGKADSPDADNEAYIKGEYSGNCKPIPTLSFKTKASGTFEGTAKYKEGKAGITYENKEPFDTRGYFELGF